MAAVFGAASRATFTFIVFAFEITRDYNAILPLMLACVIADLIGLRYLKSSIMTEKLARRGLFVPEEYEAGILKVVRVSEVMRTDVVSVPPDMAVGELAERMSRNEPGYNATQGMPIVTNEGKLTGVVTQGDLLRALQKNPTEKLTVFDAGSQKPIVAYPDEFAYDVLYRMLQNNIGRLPVVKRGDPDTLVGYLNRSSVLSAWTRQIEEENLREHGWIDQLLKTRHYHSASARKTAIGKVTDVGEEAIELAGSVDGAESQMKFALSRRAYGIAEGDIVKVTYRRANGDNLAESIQELRTR
jgi:CBS domain-containing protein